MRRPESRRFLKFLIIGGTAFWVHVGLVYLLVQGFGFPATPSYIIVFMVITTGTWLGNRAFTFGVKTAPSWRDYFLYLRGMIMGGSINVLIFALVVRLLPLTHWDILIATACGTLGGLLWNYFFMRRMWGPKPPPAS